MNLDHKYHDKHEKAKKEPIVNVILKNTEKLKKKGNDIPITEISQLEFPFLNKTAHPGELKITETPNGENLFGQYEIGPKECSNCQSKFGTFHSPVPCESCTKFFCDECCSYLCKLFYFLFFFTNFFFFNFFLKYF